MPKKNVPSPGNVGADSGSGSGSGTPETESTPAPDATQEPESTQERSWTRGNDPTAAAEALQQANRGSSGAENQPVPKSTPA
jgi:hypothetical protein